VTWQKCFSLRGPSPAAPCPFLAEVNRPGPGCHRRLGCTRAGYNKTLLMLLSWLGATSACSPECLSGVPAGDRGILPFPSRLPTVKQSLCSLLARPRAAIPMGRLELVPRRAGPPLGSHKGAASCAALEGPRAFKWVRARQWAALCGLGKRKRGGGTTQAGMIASSARGALPSQRKPGVSVDRLRGQGEFFLEEELGSFREGLAAFLGKPAFVQLCFRDLKQWWGRGWLPAAFPPRSSISGADAKQQHADVGPGPVMSG